MAVNQPITARLSRPIIRKLDVVVRQLPGVNTRSDAIRYLIDGCPTPRRGGPGNFQTSGRSGF